MQKNAKLPLYFTLVPDPLKALKAATNALPPTALITQTVNKMLADKAGLILIVPLLPHSVVRRPAKVLDQIADH